MIEISVKEPQFGASGARGDGSTDDTKSIQAAIDFVARGGGRVFLPAGNYLTNYPLNLYGDGVELVGESGTVIIVNHHMTGLPGATGVGLSLAPVLSDPIFLAENQMIGGDIFICNGRGATALIEVATGGKATGFNELAPCEFIGRGPLLGVYDNAAPTNTTPTEAYAHHRQITIPCRNILIENIAFDFADDAGDCSIQIKYGQNIRIKNVSVLRTPTVDGGKGGIAITGSQNCILENILSANIGIGLNSCRGVKVRDCDVKTVTLEESCIGNWISQNTIRATGTIGIRINDNGCRRNAITFNTIYNAADNMGAIGIAEGIDNLIIGNICRDGADNIWVNGSGNIIARNIAGGIEDFSGKNFVH